MTRADLLLSLLTFHASRHPEAPLDVDRLIRTRRAEQNLRDANEALARAQARLGEDLSRVLQVIE